MYYYRFQKSKKKTKPPQTREIHICLFPTKNFKATKNLLLVYLTFQAILSTFLFLKTKIWAILFRKSHLRQQVCLLENYFKQKIHSSFNILACPGQPQPSMRQPSFGKVCKSVFRTPVQSIQKKCINRQREKTNQLKPSVNHPN